MKHAKLSASKAERWINCPGSMQLTEDVPETDESSEKEFAREGSVAHWLADRSLELDKHPKHWINMVHQGVTITEEMARYVAEYVEHVKQLNRRCVQSQREMRVELKGARVPSELSGTPDFCGVTKSKELHIVDLKYGAGVFVDVEDWQFRAYAAYYLSELPEVLRKSIKKVIVTVYQPRIENDEGPWRSAEYTVADVVKFGHDLIAAAWATVQPDAPLKPGRWCQFCPVAARCPALQETAKEVVLEAFEERPLRDITKLSDEEIAKILTLAPTIKKWLGSVEDHALNHVVAGGSIPGLKLVEKKTHRRWSKPDEIAAAMKQHGISEDVLFEKKLKTPAAVERLLGKLKSVVGPLTYKPKSVTLAPTTDPRPEVGNVTDMFADTENEGDTE